MLKLLFAKLAHRTSHLPDNCPSVLGLVLIACFSLSIDAAPKKKALDFWLPHDVQNTTPVDHSPWQRLLDKYLIGDHSSGINRFRYSKVAAEDKTKLQSYIKSLAARNPRTLSRPEQMAYWINLYNALTVKLIVDNYPVESIKNLGKGFFSFGPWDDDIVEIEQQKLTLNHIEHGILRPIFNDPRIHYAVNCASLGCPNLSARAFTAENLESLLTYAAKTYVNHPRGVSLKDNKLVISSIYHWFKEDFGDSQQALIDHLVKYAQPELQTKLRRYRGGIKHEYDWKLNKP